MATGSNGSEFFVAPASVSQARAGVVLPNKGSEDARHLLHHWTVEQPSGNQADRDYLPTGKVDWVLHLDFPSGTILKKSSIREVFSAIWTKEHDCPTLYGFSPESHLWTFVNAGGVPDSFSKLQLAWKLRSTENDQPLPADRLANFLAATKEAAMKLNASDVHPSTSPDEAAKRSSHLLELVGSCDACADVVLAANTKAGFEGKAIWDVMLSLGLGWGDMDLFHWENPGIPGDDHLFSVWTSTPPGYFFPESIAQGKVRTTDLIFGFSVPRTWQPDTVLDSMLQAVQYAKRRLGGIVLDSNGSEFSERVLKAEIQKTVMTMTDAGFPPGSYEALYLL